MIKKIFIEDRNDERTNILRHFLNLEKIPYYYIKEAEIKDFETSLFLFTSEISIKANHKIIFNPELLKRPLKVNQLERLKLKVSIDNVTETLNHFNLNDDIDLPNVPIYKEIDSYAGETLFNITVDKTQYPAVTMDKNTIYFFFDILILFNELISETYFEKDIESNILSNKLLDRIYKLIPYDLRLKIYKRYYSKVHKELEKSAEFTTKFPVDPTVFALLELIKYSILLQTDLATINKWPGAYNYATLITHDTEPTIFSYTKGLKLLLDKLDEYNLKSTITLVGSYVKYISPEDIERLKKHYIGCHGLYHDRTFLQVPNYEKKLRLEKAKEIIENTFNTEILFFRAPTLQRPANLFELLEEKNYKYDSSIIDVQREQPYCGKGNSFYLPFYPLINNKRSQILELNITAPDCISPYFFGYSMPETLDFFSQKIKFIEKVNGLCTFIIHTPAWGPKDAENRLMLLDHVIKNTRNSWVATVKEIVKWWEARSNLFLEFKDNKLHLINKNNFEISNIKIKLENRNNQSKDFLIKNILPNQRIVVK